MAMSRFFFGILVISLVCAALTDRGSALAAAAPEGAAQGISLGLSMAGSLCLWCGVGRLLDKGGVTGALSRLLRPILNRLFPDAKRDPALAGALSANFCANLLGLGNAATPMGIRAVQRMADPARPGIATDQMCRLIVLNTASVQLIPATVAAVRSGLGAGAPFDILPAVWLSSACSAGLGVAAAVFLGSVWRHD